jgi:molybdopterin converting factor small subunit
MGGRPMRLEVQLSGPVRVVIGAPRVVLMWDTSSVTLTQALDALGARYPRAQRYLRDGAGDVPPALRILLNDTRLDGDAPLATPLRDGDRLALLMPVAGG